ncbi:MAG: sugar transferase [Waddliaceae bacterium]
METRIQERANATHRLTLLMTMNAKVKHSPIKRLFDVCGSIILLIVCLPLFLVISLVIKLTTSGKVIYSQVRIGRGGRPFRFLKFRTMYQDADNQIKKILASDPKKLQEWTLTYKLKQDPRVTPIGRFLRKTSLDELPQLWNVLKGDLSLVGPRPVVHEEIIKYFGAKATKILSIRPGITGIWQVSGRNDTTYNTRIKLDEEYVDTQSWLLDLKILLKTIPCMISARGAY